MNTPGTSGSGYALLLFIQFLLLIVYGIYTDYGDELRPKNGTQEDKDGKDGEGRFILPKYARKSLLIENFKISTVKNGYINADAEFKSSYKSFVYFGFNGIRSYLYM